MIARFRLNGFTIVELLLAVSIISMIVLVSAPSIYGVFKRQFLTISVHTMVQDIRDVQSSAFIEHRYHKVLFNANDHTYSLFVYDDAQWELMTTKALDDDEIFFGAILNNETQLIYSPEGSAFVCNDMAELDLCIQEPLTATASIDIRRDSDIIYIEFLPHNGFVQSSYSIN